MLDITCAWANYLLGFDPSPYSRFSHVIFQGPSVRAGGFFVSRGEREGGGDAAGIFQAKTQKNTKVK